MMDSTYLKNLSVYILFMSTEVIEEKLAAKALHAYLKFATNFLPFNQEVSIRSGDDFPTKGGH